MSIEITNMDEFKKELIQHLSSKFKVAGFLLEGEIRNQVEKMKLMGNPPNLWQRGYHTTVEVNGDKISLVLETGLPYAVYLEYGTYAYFDSFGTNNFPATPDPKKKHMSTKEKKNFPRGMQPFAPIRRVMWNNQKMGNILSKVLK